MVLPMNDTTRKQILYALLAVAILAVLAGIFFGVKGALAAIGAATAVGASAKAMQRTRERVEQEHRIDDAADSAGELADELDDMRDTLDGARREAEDHVADLDDEGKAALGEDLLGPGSRDGS